MSIDFVLSESPINDKNATIGSESHNKTLSLLGNIVPLITDDHHYSASQLDESRTVAQYIEVSQDNSFAQSCSRVEPNNQIHTTTIDSSIEIQFKGISLEDRIAIIRCYYTCSNWPAAAIKKLRNEGRPSDLLSEQVIIFFVEKFEKTGNIVDDSKIFLTEGDFEVYTEEESPNQNQISSKDSQDPLDKGGLSDIVHHSEDFKKSHVCQICLKKYRNASTLKDHMYSHTGEKPFSCHICDAKFSRKYCLTLHHLIHSGEKPHKCHLCAGAFRRRVALRKHYAEDHSQDIPFICKNCHSIFHTEEELKSHSITHHTDNRIKDIPKLDDKSLHCSLCSKIFQLNSSLKMHIRLQHTEGRFKCDQCSKSFHKKRMLQRHMLSHCEGEQRQQLCYECTICNKQFKFECHLKHHLLVHEGKAKPLNCSICRKELHTKSGLRHHLLSHGENKPFKCDQCPRTFVKHSLLQNHIMTHAGLFPYICDYCGKNYEFKRAFKEHLNSHTGEHRTQCEHCGKLLSSGTTLKRHLLTHLNEKRYQCECGKSYLRKDKYKEHLKTHPK